MVLPVLLIVLAMALWVLAAVSAQLRCTDAAAVGARAAGRGDMPGAVVAAARTVAPSGASVQVQPGELVVQVVVRVEVRPLDGALRALPGFVVSGRAVAAREDRVGAR